MIKERFLEQKEERKAGRRKEGRKMERAEIWLHTVDDHVLHGFYKSHLMIETKIITPCDTQDNNI